MDGLWCLVPLSTIENDIDKCVVDCTNTFGNEHVDKICLLKAFGNQCSMHVDMQVWTQHFAKQD